MLTLETGRQLADAALKEAARVGKPMSIALVDASGYAVTLDRMTGGLLITPSVALSKAYSAAIMRRPTAKLKVMAESEPVLFAQIAGMGHQPIVACFGGLPIKKDGEVIGGIGVSGGSGTEDEEVANSALTALGFDVDF